MSSKFLVTHLRRYYFQVFYSFFPNVRYLLEFSMPQFVKSWKKTSIKEIPLKRSKPIQETSNRVLNHSFIYCNIFSKSVVSVDKLFRQQSWTFLFMILHHGRTQRGAGEGHGPPLNLWQKICFFYTK